jgi:hypothetical protein
LEYNWLFLVRHVVLDVTHFVVDHVEIVHGNLPAHQHPEVVLAVEIRRRSVTQSCVFGLFEYGVVPEFLGHFGQIKRSVKIFSF